MGIKVRPAEYPLDTMYMFTTDQLKEAMDWYLTLNRQQRKTVDYMRKFLTRWHGYRPTDAITKVYHLVMNK